MTDAVAAAHAALERARDAGVAAIEQQASHRCPTCGSSVRVVSDREGTSYYTPVAHGLAETVQAAGTRVPRAEAEQALLVLGRAREAALASLSNGELRDLVGDYASYDRTVMEAAQMAARGRALAQTVLAADAMLADLDAQGGPSRLVELAVWDQIVQLARKMLG